jgi:hypothetical protein
MKFLWRVGLGKSLGWTKKPTSVSEPIVLQLTHDSLGLTQNIFLCCSHPANRPAKTKALNNARESEMYLADTIGPNSPFLVWWTAGAPTGRVPRKGAGGLSAASESQELKAKGRKGGQLSHVLVGLDLYLKYSLSEAP